MGIKLKKGIILQSSEIFFDDAKNTVTISGTSDPREIRKSLMYWDKIAIPRNNHYRISSEEIQLLIDHNLAEEVDIFLPSNSAYLHIDVITTQLLAYQKLQELKNDAWTLGQYTNLHPNNDDFIDANIVEINLINALPCPPNETPIFEVLEFKEKHGERIQLLQYEIEDFTNDIIKSLYPPRTEDRKLREIQKIIDDIKQVSNKSWVQNIIPSFQMGISLSDSKELFSALLSSYAAYQATSTIGLGDTISTLAALGTGITIAPKKEKTPYALKSFDSLYFMEKQFPGSIGNLGKQRKIGNKFSDNFLNPSILSNWNQPRLSQCWCVSGKRFKDCHGAIK